MLKLTINGNGLRKELDNYLNNNLQKKISSIVGYTADEMVKRAQRKFKSAEYDGNNDVYVYKVRATSLNDKSICTYKIVAEGTATLFVEFGAGLHYANRQNEHPLRQTAIPPVSELGWYGVENHTFDKNWFGSRGKDDFWVYKSYGMIPQKPTDYLGIVGLNDDKPRFDYAWTKGNKPARAMYSAVTYFYREFSNNVNRGG